MSPLWGGHINVCQLKQRLAEEINCQAFNTVECLLTNTTHKQKLACSESQFLLHTDTWTICTNTTFVASHTCHVVTPPELKFFQVPMASAYKMFNKRFNYIASFTNSKTIFCFVPAPPGLEHCGHAHFLTITRKGKMC